MLVRAFVVRINERIRRRNDMPRVCDNANQRIALANEERHTLQHRPWWRRLVRHPAARGVAHIPSRRRAVHVSRMDIVCRFFCRVHPLCAARVQVDVVRREAAVRITLPLRF